MNGAKETRKCLSTFENEYIVIVNERKDVTFKRPVRKHVVKVTLTLSFPNIP